MPDEATCQEIDKTINRTIKDAGLKGPPFLIEDILYEIMGTSMFSNFTTSK